MATKDVRSRRSRQVVFSVAQSHSRNFELIMIAICILCIIVAVVIAKGTDWGVTTRP
jgi:predicted nucleic acid-binding Zn ribbon protein